MIEPKSLLDDVQWWKAGGKRRDLQRRLINRFMGWNQDFNGEILKPGPCDVLEISSGLLAKIIEGLYFPKCPYRFEVIGVELLGSIYERYLGKTIRVTPQRVKIEEKPEVRKAGGVFYTPQYIVDYIVKNTVGKKIEGKTPNQIEGIRILDPACGSGSFLLTAYQTLIDYHLVFYEKHPKESTKGTLFPDVITDFNNTKRLSIEKKAQILKNNIFGVDIDPQAVEIAMMSLYLKCLEDEKDLPRKKELLPSLFNNVRCGNSLISYDLFDQMTLFDEEEKERINPFDWHSKSTGFGQIMEKRGFDVVIGNPPYIDVKLIGKDLKAILKDKYVSASKRFDLYNLFIEKSVLLSARKGLLGFIIPSMFMRREYGKSLRDYLSKNTSFLKIIDFGTNQIFNKAMNYVSIIILSKSSLNNSVNIVQFNKTGLSSFEIKKAIEMENTESIKYFSLNQNQFRTDSEWFLHDETTNFLMKRFFSGFVTMNDILTFASEGIHSGKDEVFFVKSSFHKENNFENEITWPLAKGKDIHRYYPINSKTLEYYVIYPYDIKTGYVLNDKYLSKMTPNIMTGV